MCSEVAEMIQKGIHEVRNASEMSTIFEASLNIYQVPKGNNMGTLKQFLVNFKNEFYTERGKTFGLFHLHFYSQVRAKDCLAFLQDTAN